MYFAIADLREFKVIKVLMKVTCHRGKHVMIVIWSFWCAVQLRN